MQERINSQLSGWNLKNKRVLLRADLNIPLKDGEIFQDYRLKSALPTIDLILKKGGKVILATHMGRPEGYEERYTTKQLIPWFKKHGYAIEYEPDLLKAEQKSRENSSGIILLENLRFFSGEKKFQKDFAQKIANLGDYYVNDAFALLHRDDTSITQVPLLFSSEKRSIGLLIEKELHQLNMLFQNPLHPFVLIIGGKKVKTKIPIIECLLPKLDYLLLCPAPVFTFLKAEQKPVGTSLVDNSMLKTSEIILNKAKQNHVQIPFPVDYLIAQNNFDGPLTIVSSNQFPPNGFGVAIGPETSEHFCHIIKQAKTIFYNGLMGNLDRKETLIATEKIFKAMADSQGTSIIAGGDSVAAAYLFGLNEKIDYLSTGGGATLLYLSEKKLPGLAPYETH